MLSRVFILAGLFALATLGAGGCGGCGDDDFPADARALDAAVPGTVSVAWKLTDPTNSNAPVTCDQVGATTVFIQLHGRSTASGVGVSLSCTLTPGTSQPIPPDTYDVSYELHAGSAVLATAPDQDNVVVKAGLNTQLSDVVFGVQASGGLALTLAAQGLTSNCKSTAMGGAGITSMTITLIQASGGCEPVSFAVTRAGASVGSYTVNCSSPMVGPCFETDETLTATSVPSGPYIVHVVGKQNAAACWTNDDSLRVPPLGKTQSQALTLGFQSTTGCVK